MKTARSRALNTIAVSFMLLTFVILSGANSAFGQSMTFYPSKIVLNQQGIGESYQAIIPLTLTPGFMFSSCEAILYLGGFAITHNYYASYRYSDENLLVYFDRDMVLSSEVVEAEAGTIQPVIVEGYIITVDSEGCYLRQDFCGYDEVEIIAQNKKSQ